LFFINNGIYGMTGGQMAATSLIGTEDYDQSLWPQRRE